MAGTGPNLGSRDAINAHAQKLISEAVAKGSVSLPDGESAAAAASVPSFSAGTVAIDDAGRVSVPHETPATALDSTRPVGTLGALSDDADAGAADEAAAAGRAADAPRDDRGKFTKTPTEPAAQPKPAKAAKAPKTEAQKDAAADAAAADILDSDDWDDLTFEHDDGSKYTVRAKKAERAQVERFNQRQAQVDRAKTWLGKFKPTLEPLITSGQLDPILPILQRALQDPEFGQFLTQAFNRRLIGQPLTPQGTQVVDRPTPGQASPAATAMPEITDPWIAEQIGPILARYQSESQELRNQLAEFQRTQETAAQQQQRQAAERSQREARLGFAHQELARKYPSMWTGDINRDRPAWDAAWRYARDSGLLNSHELGAAVIFAAEEIMRQRADTASPAAAMIEQVDRAQMRAAAAQASNARSIAGGGGSPTPAPRRPAPPAKPGHRDANGKMKDPRTFMQEAQAYAEAVSQQA